MERRQFLVLGLRKMSNGKPSLGLVPLPVPEGKAVESSALWWSSKSVMKALSRYTPGDILSIPAEEEEETWRIFSNKAMYEERWPDDRDRMEWTAEHRAVKVDADAQRAVKNRDALEEALEPVRVIYQQQVGRNRVAMLADILRILGA